MLKVTCPRCGTRYRLPSERAGTVFQCGQCRSRMGIKAPGSDAVGRRTLRGELERLASDDEAAEPADRAAVSVALSEPSQWTHRRVLTIALVAAGAVLVAGLGAWLLFGGRAAGETPQEVLVALARARRPHEPGEEAEALRNWHAARAAMLYHRKSEDAFREELLLAERRIRELQATLRARRELLDELTARLEAARSALQEGQPSRARAIAQELIEQIDGHGNLGESGETLRRAAEELLQELETAGEAPPRPAPTPAPQPARQRAAQASPVPDTSAEQRRQRIGDIRRQAARGEPEVVLDAPAATRRWYRENWANPAAIDVEPDPDTGDLCVSVVPMPGGQDKWAVSMLQPVDVSRYATLALDVKAEQPVQVAIAVWTNPGLAMFESRPQLVPKDGYREVSFSLGGQGYKSQATNWQFGAAIQNPADVMKISLLLYGAAGAQVRFRNVRLEVGS